MGCAYQLAPAPGWGSVLRGGFGIFYDLGSDSLGGSSSYFPFFAVKPLRLAPFPLSAQNAAPPMITTNPPVPDIVVAVPDLSLPRTYQWNVAVEQSLGNRQSLSVTYIGAVGRDLLRVTHLASPNANFAFVNVTDNLATSNYNALQIKLQRSVSRGLQGLVSYTFSHSIDIASTDAFANDLNTPSSVSTPNIDRGNSDVDIRHSFTTGVTYSLPTPEWNNVARATLGGWSVDSFIFARSAPPVNVASGIVFANGIELYPRPDVTPRIPLYLYGSAYPGEKIINNTPGAVPGGCPPKGLPSVGPFCAPLAGDQGNFPRNVLRGFRASQADIAFQRQFHLTEKLQLRFRGEFFNIFNHPNFGPPENNITDALFGQSTQTLANSLGSGGANGGFNPLYQIGGPRSVQLALKLQF